MAGPLDRMEQEGAVLRILGGGPLVVCARGRRARPRRRGRLEFVEEHHGHDLTRAL
ncbi:MAG: hypothetical protein U0V56_06365 [Actinomycetota bacterium]